MNASEPSHASLAGDSPLADLLVVDLSRVLTGPFAGQMLGDMGARVIKVERPEGDDTRAWGPPFVGPEDAREATYFLGTNRNKESIVLDFKNADDLAVLERLIGRADIVIENFRPGVLDRLGIGHDRMQELNPRVIVLSITGFGHDGPESGRAGYDQILQGEAGLMSFTGPPGQPSKVGVAISDILAGMFGTSGALAALHERERSGKGQIVRTSLLAGTVAIHTFQGTRYLIADDVPGPEGNKHPIVSPYGTFGCADGIIQIAVGNDAIWGRFADLTGIDAEDTRFLHNGDRRENTAELDVLIADRLGTKTVEHWLGLFAENGIPAGEVRSLDRVYSDPQVLSQGLMVETDHSTLGPIRTPGPPLRFDRSAARKHRAPPALGEHSEAIRAWLES